MGKLSTGQATGTAFWTGGGGVGIPAGGTTDQVLTKLSNADFDANWENAGSTPWAYQEFVTPATYQLDNVPILLSPQVTLLATGVTLTLREFTDYNVDYGTGLITLAFTPSAGDILQVRYQWTTSAFGPPVSLTGPTIPAGGSNGGYGDPTFAALNFTPANVAGMLIAVQHSVYGWGAGYGNLPNDPATGPVTITDSWGLVWSRVYAHQVDNTDKAAVDTAMFAAVIPAGLPAGNVHFGGLWNNAVSFAQKVLQFNHARFTGNAGAATRGYGGANTPLDVSLAVAPSAGEGVFTALSQWISFFVPPTDPAGYTQEYLVGPTGQPYSSPGYYVGAYDITTPGQVQSWGFDQGADPGNILAACSIAIAPTP